MLDCCLFRPSYSGSTFVASRIKVYTRHTENTELLPIFHPMRTLIWLFPLILTSKVHAAHGGMLHMRGDAAHGGMLHMRGDAAHGGMLHMRGDAAHGGCCNAE